jgi:hypothetical protein
MRLSTKCYTSVNDFTRDIHRSKIRAIVGPIVAKSESTDNEEGLNETRQPAASASFLIYQKIQTRPPSTSGIETLQLARLSSGVSLVPDALPFKELHREDLAEGGGFPDI